MSLVFLSLLGCDHTGFEFRPAPSDAPSVADLGELVPLDVEEWQSGDRDPLAFPSSVVYAEVGADENPGNITGATARFRGTGGNVCLVVDPEAVYWARSLASTGAGRYEYDDDYTDDGDIDMDAGLTAFYTGSPGVEMGDFKSAYTDEVGVDHEIEFNACIQTGFQGAEDVHAGRATVEQCVVNTDQQAGTEFTIALRTFSLPLNDSKLGFAIGVFDVGDAKCDGVFQNGVDAECLFANEGSAGVEGDRTDIELAYCDGAKAVNEYCAEHLDDENAPCNEPTETYDGGGASVDTGA